MTVFYIILGSLLTVLFFLHIKSAADILCRIIGGFCFLYIYNMAAVHFLPETIGINIITAAIFGFLGLPGALLLLCLGLFL